MRVVISHRDDVPRGAEDVPDEVEVTSVVELAVLLDKLGRVVPEFTEGVLHLETNSSYD